MLDRLSMLPEEARTAFVKDLYLPPDRRQSLIAELCAMPAHARESLIEDIQAEVQRQLSIKAPQPRPEQLVRYFTVSVVPFVAFGFADNFIMILCGQQFEVAFGSIFHFSTMCAAGFGNLFSDLIGLGIGGYIEDSADKMGFKPHGLTDSQHELRVVKATSAAAAVIGISVGCILGMVPLLFEDSEHRRMRVLFHSIDLDRNGYLDEQELSRAFEKAHIYMKDCEIRRLMAKADENHDGLIDFEEFIVMFHHWKGGMQEMVLKLAEKEIEEEEATSMQAVRTISNSLIATVETVLGDCHEAETGAGSK